MQYYLKNGSKKCEVIGEEKVQEIRKKCNRQMRR
jgi:hypothetical protein